MIATVGAVLAITVRSIWSLASRPMLFITEAVIVCTPTDRSEREILAPTPSRPSGFDVQISSAEMFPSALSVAVPEKSTGAPSTAVVPS